MSQNVVIAKLANVLGDSYSMNGHSFTSVDYHKDLEVYLIVMWIFNSIPLKLPWKPTNKAMALKFLLQITLLLNTLCLEGLLNWK